MLRLLTPKNLVQLLSWRIADALKADAVKRVLGSSGVFPGEPDATNAFGLPVSNGESWCW